MKNESQFHSIELDLKKLLERSSDRSRLRLSADGESRSFLDRGKKQQTTLCDVMHCILAVSMISIDYQLMTINY